MFNSIYSAGRFLHDRLLASEFRTTNPEEADFFFVPVWGRAAGFGPPRANSRCVWETRDSVPPANTHPHTHTNCHVDGAV